MKGVLAGILVLPLILSGIVVAGSRSTASRCTSGQVVQYSDGSQRCLIEDGAAGGEDWAALPGSTAGEKVVNAALAYTGTQYSWGGGAPSGPTTGICCSPKGQDARDVVGFDCSGLVLYAWAKAGVKLPHSAHNIVWSSGGTVIPRDLAIMKPGDVIGFSYLPGGHVFHVGIYMGGGRMIDSDSSGVAPDSLTSGYYARLYWRVVRF